MLNSYLQNNKRQQIKKERKRKQKLVRSMQLSFSLSDIKVHRSIFKVYNVDDLKCPLCLSAVDNEVHYLFYAVLHLMI